MFHFFCASIFHLGATVQKKIFVTTSLPYANGPLHLGHMLEQIQADIWVRFKRLTGHECVFVSGDDAHGSAIMLSAQKQNITPQAWIDQIWSLHHADSQAFNISYDVYHTTRSEENAGLVKSMYATIKKNGFLRAANIKQLYDTEAKMFLPDRFIKGACPKCSAQDQYGDNCEVCGATYASTELVDPYSVLTKTTPELRDSEHVFFLLGKQQPVLQQWLESSSLQAPIRNKLLEWFEHGLKDWDISRDAPYFGFTIPGYDDKYFYVWVDAPMGYIAGLSHFLANQGKQELCDQICSPESDWEMHHFIGKDIIYFHGLFWPAILQAAEYRMPTALHAHGFLTIDGQKMSKSRGTFITAKQYHEKLSPEYLRYYFAGKLNDGVGDMDLAWDDFTARCNADLIGKIINIGSRCAGFIHKHFAGKTASSLECEKLFTTLADAQDAIADAYDTKQFSAAVRQIIQLADGVNQYIDQKKPWVMIKEEGQKDHVHKVCTSALTAFHQLMIYLSPVLPDTAAKTASFFLQEGLSWQALTEPLLDRQITPFPRMLERITKEDCPIDQAQSA